MAISLVFLVLKPVKINFPYYFFYKVTAWKQQSCVQIKVNQPILMAKWYEKHFYRYLDDGGTRVRNKISKGQFLAWISALPAKPHLGWIICPHTLHMRLSHFSGYFGFLI